MPTATRLADMRGLMPIAATHARADAQEAYRALRAKWGTVAPVELEPGINAWLVMGYEELSSVARNERLFAKSSLHWRDYSQGRVAAGSALGPLMFPRPNAWMTDGEEHRRVRAPLDDAVHGLRLRQVARQAAQACEALIGEFAAAGEADLMGQYAVVIPAVVIGRWLGLDLDSARELHHAQMAVFSAGESSGAGAARLEEILSALVASRKAAPADDMTSVIVHHPGMRTDEERVHAMVALIAPAAAATMAWIGQTLQLMLTDARFSARMRGGRIGIDDALDEVLWREPPVASLPARFALRDTVLGRQAVEKGDCLILGFAAANADPRMQDPADQLSELGNRSHLAFGTGPHMCPAHVPGRLIVRTAVETALYKLLDLRLRQPRQSLGRLESPWVRCPAALPVAFRPPAARGGPVTSRARPAARQ